MGGLIGLRAAQGSVTGATISVTQGIVADVYAPAERGSATGWYFVPLLLGPIIAPVLGGFLVLAFDWRAVFIFCAALAAPALALMLALPETQHWHFLRRREAVARAETAAAAAAGRPPPPPLSHIAEEGAGEVLRPTWNSPLVSILYLVDLTIAPYTSLFACLFGLLFSSLTSLPLVLESTGLSAGAAGACFLPIGAAMLVGSIVGGRLSDNAGAAAPGVPGARLVPSLVGASTAVCGSLIFGYCAASVSAGGGGGALAGLLIGHALIGAGHALFNPGFFAFISTVKQSAAAGVSGAAMAASFAAAGVSVSASVPVATALGIGALFSIFAAVIVAALSWAACDLRGRWVLLKAVPAAEVPLPDNVVSAKPDDALAKAATAPPIVDAAAGAGKLVN